MTIKMYTFLKNNAYHGIISRDLLISGGLSFICLSFFNFKALLHCFYLIFLFFFFAQFHPEIVSNQNPRNK